MSDISKEQRYEIVGLTKAEVDRCMEVLCGGPVRWDRGYCFASSELFARPSRYGPEPYAPETRTDLWGPFGNDGMRYMESADVTGGATAAMSEQRSVSQPPSRIGPTEPDDTMVICPVCTSQFRAIPLDVQRARAEPPPTLIPAPDLSEHIAWLREHIERLSALRDHLACRASEPPSALRKQETRGPTDA